MADKMGVNQEKDENVGMLDEDILKNPNEMTECGIWCFKGPNLQRFANKKMFIFVNGLMGLTMVASFTYFGGTISTIEKRFKLNSRTTGFITIGNDVSTLMFGAFVTYYAGKQGHHPRWIALGVYSVVLFCLLNALPHVLYGAGDDANALTVEYSDSHFNPNSSLGILEQQNKQMLCQTGKEAGAKCQSGGQLGPVMILFLAQFIAGIGGSLYMTLGTTYMDDNIKKSKTPALISISYFIRMLGPALGSALAGYCLSLYISPNLHPKIDNRDPRWLGAWWLGWILLAVVMFFWAGLLALFPKQLPRSYIRRQQALAEGKIPEVKEESKPSITDFFVTLKRLGKNKILMCNNFAGIFYFVGYMPFITFGAKYTEIMFKISASKASFVTGTIGLGFSAAGLVVSGLVISKFKPSARKMAAWNVFVSCFSVAGLISYAFISCATRENKGFIEGSNQLQTTFECNANCNCEFVKYSPVCANGETFISPCHAGCEKYQQFPNGTKIYTECSCALNQTFDGAPLPPIAIPGPCPVDCSFRFKLFLVIVCLLKFTGATGRATNFLVALRCVDEKDKSASMGLGSAMISLFAFVPSPIIFGYIIDTTCLVWGQTCSGSGNCWLYDGFRLRYILNFTAAFFVFIGTLFDCGVWYLVKDLKVFDNEQNKEPTEDSRNKEMTEIINRKTKENGEKETIRVQT